MPFKDKVAVVTGGLGGIGLACAEGLAAGGARLVLIDLKVGDGSTVDRLCAMGAAQAVAIALDVADEIQVSMAVARARTELGGFDILINVAGMMIYKPLAELTGADWRRLLDVNLLGAAFFTGEAMRHMTDGGAIVNIASVHARQTSPLVAPYAAAKAALESLTRTTAIEGRARNIRANAVLPGAIDTPMLWSSPNLASGAEVLSPQDIGKPRDIAAAALYLASEEARFITGSSLLVDGGRLARL